MGLTNGIPCVLLMLESHMSILSYCPRRDRWDCPMESHTYYPSLNPMCPSCPTVPCGTDGTVQWNPMCTICTSIPCVRLILLSHVGQLGLSNGISHIPLELESRMSILFYCTMLDRWDCPMESYVYYSCLNPTHPSCPTVPCGTDDTLCTVSCGVTWLNK